VESSLDSPTSALSTAETVELRVPAHGAFLSLVRTTTAAVGARVDLTIDEIEDLRIAVDEAAAILLPAVIDDGDVTVVYTLRPRQMTILLSAPTGESGPVDQSGFGWTVLAALAGSVHSETVAGRTEIELTHRREAL
jgi:serine/threonine-protein kinase RsbW